MRAKLTDRNLNRKPPADGTTEIWDAVVPGLALRVHAGGRRAFCVTTRLHGRQIRRTIGNTVTHSLREARDEARAIIADAAKGIDAASKEARREAARAAQVERERAKANSVRAVVEGYLADAGTSGGAHLKSRREVERSFENHAMPAFGDRPIGSITRAEVRDLLRMVGTNSGPVAANRLLSGLKRAFKWAVENDKIDASPVGEMDKPFHEVSRDRVLIDSELAEVWRACDGLSAPYGGAVRLMILTGGRKSEASGLRRSEIQGNDWHLPAERSKNGRPHIVPLSELAREVIAGVPQIDGGDPVFTLDGSTCINGWSKAKALLDRIIAEARAAAAGERLDMDKHSMAHWVPHDLRRSLVTGMVEALGVAPHVVESVINHVSGASRAGVAGTYNRSVLLPQRREALEAWARHIAALVGGAKPAANVTRFTRRAAI